MVLMVLVSQNEGTEIPHFETLKSRESENGRLDKKFGNSWVRKSLDCLYIYNVTRTQLHFKRHDINQLSSTQPIFFRQSFNKTSFHNLPKLKVIKSCLY